jgi:hypothetical protein
LTWRRPCRRWSPSYVCAGRTCGCRSTRRWGGRTSAVGGSLGWLYCPRSCGGVACCEICVDAVNPERN